jgi:SpoVK/Ycf46/Vps4 family AAA+-type ATPase
VQAAAEALGWPLVRLNPGSFIEKGLEAIESESQSLFERLQRIRRAVVLFDECDELFRDRNPTPDNEAARTITAFVTASMLPKLQDLHDTGRVLFFICTNHVRAMDAAVLRGGRIDHRIAVGPPDESARRRILESLVPTGERVRFGPTALSELARRALRFSRGELLRTGAALLEAGPWRNQAEARRAARTAVQAMAESLTITEVMYANFLEDQTRFSDVYLERTVAT